MEENMYRFGVDADTTSAEEKLNKIVKLMDDIDALNEKAGDNYFHSTQKDIDRNMKAMQELIKLHKALERQLSSMKSERASVGDSKGVRDMNDSMNLLNRTLDTTRNKFQETADSRQAMSGLNRNLIKDQERFNTELKDEVKYLQQAKALTRDIRGAERRVKSRTANYSSAGRMTANQARVFRGDMDSLEGAKNLRQGNDLKIDEFNKQINSIDRELSDLAKNTSKNNQERLNEESALKNMRRTLEDSISELQKMNSAISDIPETISQTKNRMQDVSVDADPRSMAGQMASRAPSIMIALLGAFAGTFGGLYAKGGTANKAMREPTVSIGQRTGNYDFRSVRKQAQEMGLEPGLNYKGMDMLGFQETALGSMGFTNQDTLSDVTRAMAEGGRATPVPQEQLSQFLGDVMRNGSVSTGEQTRAIQEAFLGAIQQSGMIGREKEQLDALTSLNQQLFAGRNGNQQELNNMIALQTMLSENGGRSLQGAQGAQALTDLDAGLKGATSNNMAKLLFGRGTKYQGREGNFLLEEQLEKGIGDPENIARLFDASRDMAGGKGSSEVAQMDTFKRISRQLFGTDLTGDQVRGFYEATDGGRNLSKEAIAKVQQQIEEQGSSQFAENAEGYADSKEAIADRSEAVTEKQASYLNDMGDLFRKVNSAMGGLPSLLYAFAGAVTASIGALATSSLMSLGSGGIKKLTQTLFGGKGTASAMTTAGKATVAGGGFLSTMKGAFQSGKSTGGFMGGIKQAGGFLKDTAMFKGSETLAKGKAMFQGSKTTANAMGEAGKAGGFLGKLGGGLGKVGKFAGKAMPWLAVGASAVDIATSEDKGKAVGRNAGQWGGMALGAKGGAGLGATIGSFIMPGIGTAIGAGLGGLAGGIGGSFAGSKIGEWATDKVRGAWGGIKNLFGSKEVNASELDSEEALQTQASLESGAGGQETAGDKEAQNRNAEEKDTTDKKLQSEKAREKNVMDEGANLSLFSTLLDRASQLLTQARAQNGIFGSANGGGSDSLISGGSSGSLGTVGDGKKWTNTDITKHDLGETVMGITAKEIDDWISSVAPKDSPMRGMGSLFLQAGKESGLDPRYLVAHSALETGWGTSNLSLKGDKEKGNWFGIGAFDNNPNNGYNYDLGLAGGAKWIADNYYNNGQKNLHDMVNDPGGHNYATDPGWADKIASIMKGSESYTKGNSAQSFNTTNSVTVNVNSSDSKSNANKVGNRVGTSVQLALDDAIGFYSKELRRV